jgi:hypothetical protein
VRAADPAANRAATEAEIRRLDRGSGMPPTPERMVDLRSADALHFPMLFVRWKALLELAASARTRPVARSALDRCAPRAAVAERQLHRRRLAALRRFSVGAGPTRTLVARPRARSEGRPGGVRAGPVPLLVGDAEGRVMRRPYAMTWRPITRHKLQLMLGTEGSRSFSLEGGHICEPFTAQSPRLFVLAQKI